MNNEFKAWGGRQRHFQCPCDIQVRTSLSISSRKLDQAYTSLTIELLHILNGLSPLNLNHSSKLSHRQPGGCGFNCVYTGEDVLAFNGIRDNSYAFNIGILTLMLGGYRLLLVGALMFQEMRRKASGARAPARVTKPAGTSTSTYSGSMAK